MASSYFTVETKGLIGLMETLEDIGKGDLMRKAVEKAFLEGAEKAHDGIKKALVKPNMPSEVEPGMYSKMGTAKHAQSHSAHTIEPFVKWNNKDSIYTKIGIDSKGIDPVGTQVLIYGTAVQSPVKGLKNAIYGEKVLEDIAYETSQRMAEELEKLLNSK